MNNHATIDQPLVHRSEQNKKMRREGKKKEREGK